MQSRGRNLPSVLPGEETFVCQSQKVALSSTAAEDEIEVIKTEQKTQVMMAINFVNM